VERGRVTARRRGQSEVLRSRQPSFWKVHARSVYSHVATIAARSRPDTRQSSHCEPRPVFALACRSFLFRERFQARRCRLSVFCCRNNAIDGSLKSGWFSAATALVLNTVDWCAICMTFCVYVVGGKSKPGRGSSSAEDVVEVVVVLEDGLGNTLGTGKTRACIEVRAMLSSSSSTRAWSVVDPRTELNTDARSRLRTLSCTRERRDGCSSSSMPASNALESGSGLCMACFSSQPNQQ